MENIKAVIFDLDGTLIDSAPDIQHAVNRLMDELGEEAFDLDTIAGFIGNGVRKLMERVSHARDLPTRDVDENTERFRVFYAEEPASKTIVFDGVARIFEALHADGIKIGICTNKPEDISRKILQDFGLHQYVDGLVGGDTTKALKPDPLPLETCLAILGREVSESIYVGDSAVDAKTAKALGIRFCLYDGGYSHGKLGEIDAGFCFSNFDELSQFISNSAA